MSDAPELAPGVVLPIGFSAFEKWAGQVGEKRDAWVDGLSEKDIEDLAHNWVALSRKAQQSPDGAWRTWLILAGRGFGKTRAGAEWVRALAESDGRLRIALVAATLNEARAVMVEGETGLLAIAAPNQRPRFEASNRRLVWGSGAQAFLYSAGEPESLRGPQHHFAWVDEIGKWRLGPQVSDPAARGDLGELRQLLGAWRDAKRSARNEVIGWIDGSDAPIGEDGESYRVTIALAGGGGRTLILVTAGYDYAPGDQAADGIAGAAGTLSIEQLGVRATSRPATLAWTF